MLYTCDSSSSKGGSSYVRNVLFATQIAQQVVPFNERAGRDSSSSTGSNEEVTQVAEQVLKLFFWRVHRISYVTQVVQQAFFLKEKVTEVAQQVLVVISNKDTAVPCTIVNGKNKHDLDTRMKTIINGPE